VDFEARCARAGNDHRLDRCHRSPSRRQYARAADRGSGTNDRHRVYCCARAIRDANCGRCPGASDANCHRASDAHLDPGARACRYFPANCLHRSHSPHGSLAYPYAASTNDIDHGGRTSSFGS